MSDCFVYTQVVAEDVLDTAEELKPGLLIVDSIQTTYSRNIESGPGSVLKYEIALLCCNDLQRHPIFQSSSLDILLKKVLLPAQVAGTYRRCGAFI